MEKNRLRKCIPLKIAVHILMAFSFAILVLCWILFVMYMDVSGSKLLSIMEDKKDDRGYFSSEMFVRQYGKELDALYYGLQVIGDGQNSGYPVSAYVGANKNFKYAVYDTKGTPVYTSDGWDLTRNSLGDGRYYYTADLCGLKLYDTDSIRRASFSRAFRLRDAKENAGGEDSSRDGEAVYQSPEKAETFPEMAESGQLAPDNAETTDGQNPDDAEIVDGQNPDDAEIAEGQNPDDAEMADRQAYGDTDAQTSTGDAAVFDGTVRVTSEDSDSEIISGAIEYGSNFTRHTSFYDYDESILVRDVGYICTYVPETLVPGDAFYDNFTMYNQWNGWGKWSVIGGAMAFLAFTICFVYLVMAAGYSHKSEGIRLITFDRLYTEISAGLLIGAAAAIFTWFFSSGYLFADNTAEIIGIAAVIAVIYVLGVFGVLSFARRVKAHVLVKNALVYKICTGAYDVIYKGFINNHLLRKYIAVVFGLGVLDFLLMFSVFKLGSALWLVFVLVIYVYEFVYVGRKLLTVQEIKYGAQKIASGELEFKIDTSQMSGVFKDFAEDINNIGNGLNAAVDESIKSERMKADLITNVSHDIKTPLTSIINYVDLMKRENITEEPLREYIEVLDMKSQRLKALTEDLVEASRASSGNIKLEKSEINFVELVAQTAGTFEEKFKTKSLETVIRTEEPEIMIMADGRRLFRVLDNLFTNAYKYSMEHSRIYIDMYVQGQKACFVMKNISSAPLNISPEELTQRFVRGDASRATEGSGLGLSIARSLTELHGGTFEIYLDGDLFKVTLMFDITVQTASAKG